MYEKIKAEIKRLKKQLIRGSSASLIVMETSCKEEAYNELLSFIESLEKEQDVDLEKEIEDYYHTNLGFILSPVDTRIIVEEIARHFYELGLKVKSDAPKIKGWIARDKRGTLNFFRAHPRRITDSRGEEYWIGHVRMKQPNEFFPDLKWEDEPIKVELTLNRI